MPDLAAVNLIHLFDLYLVLVMLIGLWRRRRVYLDSIRLGWGTWRTRKRLLGRLRPQLRVLVTRSVVVPLVVVAALTVVQMVCSRLIWKHANLPLGTLDGWKLLPLLVAVVPMLCVDVYFLVRIGRFDRASTEEYLDYAERWLGWRGRAVRVATAGVVNPTKIVDAEVKKSLEELGQTASWALWWTSVQSVCRVTFGLVVWGLWATGLAS